MYNSQELVKKIKARAKECGVLTKDMLCACGLNINTLSQMSDKKGISSFALADIADYLDCSVDYLLGRTADPCSHKQNITVAANYPTFPARLREAMRIRSVQLGIVDTKGDRSAQYWADRSDGRIDADTLFGLLDCGTDDIGVITLVAELINVSADQLVSLKKITAKNIAPFSSGALGSQDSDGLIIYTAARSEDNIQDEYVEYSDKDFEYLKSQPEAEDIL